ETDDFFRRTVALQVWVERWKIGEPLKHGHMDVIRGDANRGADQRAVRRSAPETSGNGEDANGSCALHDRSNCKRARVIPELPAHHTNAPGNNQVTWQVA